MGTTMTRRYASSSPVKTISDDLRMASNPSPGFNPSPPPRKHQCHRDDCTEAGTLKVIKSGREGYDTLWACSEKHA